MLEVNWEEPTRVLPTQNYSPSLFSGALDRQQYLWSCHFQRTEMVTVQSHHSSLLGGFKGHQSGHLSACAPGSACCLQTGTLFSSLVKFNLCLGLLLPALPNLTIPTGGAWWGWVHGFSLMPFGQYGSTSPFLKTLQHFCDILQFLSSRWILGLIISVNYKISYNVMCNRYI